MLLNISLYQTNCVVFHVICQSLGNGLKVCLIYLSASCIVHHLGHSFRFQLQMYTQEHTNSEAEVTKSFKVTDICEFLVGGNDLLEPVCDRHHDVERAKEEDKMEVGIAVDSAFFLIIKDILSPCSPLLLIVFICNTCTVPLALTVARSVLCPT